MVYAESLAFFGGLIHGGAYIRGWGLIYGTTFLYGVFPTGYFYLKKEE